LPVLVLVLLCLARLGAHLPVAARTLQLTHHTVLYEEVNPLLGYGAVAIVDLKDGACLAPVKTAFEHVHCKDPFNEFYLYLGEFASSGKQVYWSQPNGFMLTA